MTFSYTKKQQQQKKNNLPSTSSRFDCVSVEWGVAEREVLCVGTQQFGEDSLAFKAPHVLVDIAVHEAIHQGRVGMDVNVEVKVDFLQEK